MPVIDIDAHFEPTAEWLDEFPALKAKLPEQFPTDDPPIHDEVSGDVRLLRQ
jgi:hypothetical protein